MVSNILFNIILLSPFAPVSNVPAQLHWHFYYFGHFGPAAKKEIRRAMKDSGAVEDPCGTIYLARFDGKADTLFRLYPKLDGAVQCTTTNNASLIDATLAISKKEKKSRMYELTKAMVATLQGSQH